MSGKLERTREVKKLLKEVKSCLDEATTCVRTMDKENDWEAFQSALDDAILAVQDGFSALEDLEKATAASAEEDCDDEEDEANDLEQDDEDC